MTKYKIKVPVFFTVDDNYIPYLSITLKSLIEHSKKTNKYDIYVIHNELSNQSKKIVRGLVANKENFSVKFYNVSLRLQQLSIRLDVRDYYTSSTYYRLFLPELFPTVKKAIYIDSDIVLRSDIAQLFMTDLGDNLLGAIPDASVQLFPEFQKYVTEIIGVDYKKYFNAGVLVMNFEALRNYKFEKKAIKLLSHITFKVAQDQDVLNYLAKDKVTYIDPRWNVMPLGEKIEKPYLIHFNLIFKPWKHQGIMYEEYFWDIANKLNLGVILLGQLHMIPEAWRKKDFEGVEMVKNFCLEECKKADTYYAYLRKDNKVVEEVKKEKKEKLFNDEELQKEITVYHNEERAAILEKIKVLEKEGKFDQDVENDPPYVPLEPHGLDFLQKKFVSKIKSFIANHYAFRFFNHQIAKGRIVIDAYEGIDNLKYLNSGAIITANHFNPFDSIPIHKVVKKYSHRKLFKIIKEGNYSYPGLYGFFMRHCNTIPLSNNLEVMRLTMNAVDTVLNRGDLILIYPEQSMWWNYRKPKPLKIGAYRFASKNNIPILPTFITMRDTEEMDADGYPIQAYTLHILPPIYPKEELTSTENATYLQKENYRVWKELYEKVYGVALSYEDK